MQKLFSSNFQASLHDAKLKQNIREISRKQHVRFEKDESRDTDTVPMQLRKN